MNVFGTIAIAGLVVGVIAGLAFLFAAGPQVRAKAEHEMLRFGTGGVLFMLVWFLFSSGGASAQVEIAIGVIATAPLIAGLVLWIARRR
jgi:hypothetical protein